MTQYTAAFSDSHFSIVTKIIIVINIFVIVFIIVFT